MNSINAIPPNLKLLKKRLCWRRWAGVKVKTKMFTVLSKGARGKTIGFDWRTSSSVFKRRQVRSQGNVEYNPDQDQACYTAVSKDRRVLAVIFVRKRSRRV